MNICKPMTQLVLASTLLFFSSSFIAQAATDTLQNIPAVQDCMQVPTDLTQPFANITFSNQEYQASAATTLCSKLIPHVFTTKEHSLRFQAYLKTPKITAATNAMPKEISGLWLGKIRVNTNQWEERVLYIHDGAVYFFTSNGEREKIFWKVAGKTLYATTNFKYQHQFTLDTNKALTCLIDEIPTPTEIEIDPQEKVVWQPIQASLKPSYFAIAIQTKKAKIHPADSDTPIEFKKVTLGEMITQNKGSISVVTPYTLTPKASKFHLPIYHSVRYPQKSITQNFALLHPTLGNQYFAFYSQALTGRKGADIHLMLDQISLASLQSPIPTACKQADFIQFFDPYTKLNKEDQLLCAQFPFGISNQPNSSKLLAKESVIDLFDLLQQSSKLNKFVLTKQDIQRNKQRYVTTQTSSTSYTVERVESNGKATISYYFVWDGKQWKLAGVASS